MVNKLYPKGREKFKKRKDIFFYLVNNLSSTRLTPIQYHIIAPGLPWMSSTVNVNHTKPTMRR